MIRGTTPSYQFKLPFDVSVLNKVWVTFSQFDKEIFTIEESDCYLDGNVVRVELTQEQTLQLESNALLDIQLRVLIVNGSALASKVFRVPVRKILKGGVI